jgi:ADP-heptose:LPS heptosyltransferase
MKNLYKYILLQIMLFKLRRKKREIKKDTLLVIRLDAIGDYILFRNFLGALRRDKKYKDHKITLCGNKVWKDLAETFDSEVVDDFIWIERLKFLDDKDYKYSLLEEVYLRGFETAIDTIHSREILFGDSIIAASGARERIGTIQTDKLHKFKKGIFTDRFYTRLIPAEAGRVFEFNRTKEFFSKLLGYQVDIKSPEMDLTKLTIPSVIKGKYIILFPGVSRSNRMWSTGNFREVARYIIRNSDYYIVTAGSSYERELAEKVRPEESGDRFINLCGGSLTEMAGIIAGAELVISNDTSAVHFASATGRPSICIGNGFYYGRFNPYPKEVFGRAYCLYPEGFIAGKNGNVDLVSPAEVISLMNRILKEN